MLVAMSDAEMKENMKSTHHFTLLAMVMSETSSSTSSLIIQRPKSLVKEQVTAWRMK